MESTECLTVIGRYEYVSLPDWFIKGLKAKVDTGARTSSLHVERLIELPNDMVHFEILSQSKRRRRIVEARVSRRSLVRSSNGIASSRIFVTTRFILGSVEKEIEINLVNRGTMRFPMLLGRTTLVNDFVVDVAKRCVLGKPKKRQADTAKTPDTSTGTS